VSTRALDPEVARLFGGGHYAHLTTLRDDGSPQSRPVWTIVHDGRVAFFTQPGSPKARHLSRDPRVALSVVDHDSPYRSAWVRGRVGEVVEGEPALEIIDRISFAYTQQAFPMRSGSLYLVDAEAAGSAQLPFEHRPPPA
jgi:PPOX class probable F420-dependent enzyme